MDWIYSSAAPEEGSRKCRRPGESVGENYSSAHSEYSKIQIPQILRILFINILCSGLNSEKSKGTFHLSINLVLTQFQRKILACILKFKGIQHQFFEAEHLYDRSLPSPLTPYGGPSHHKELPQYVTTKSCSILCQLHIFTFRATFGQVNFFLN